MKRSFLNIGLIILVISFIFLCSCNKKITENKTIETYSIDTSVKIINPLKPVIVKGSLFTELKIDNEFFTITTNYNKKTGQNTTSFIPKKDLSIKVQMNKKIEYVNKTFQPKSNRFDYFLISVCLFVILVLIVKRLLNSTKWGV